MPDIDPMLIEEPDVLAKKKARWISLCEDIFYRYPEQADFLLAYIEKHGLDNTVAKTVELVKGKG